MLDSFETDNEIVICTEFVHSDLHKLLAKEGSIGEVRARKLSFDLVSALYYLHSHRILHRDLKPQVKQQYITFVYYDSCVLSFYLVVLVVENRDVWMLLRDEVNNS